MRICFAVRALITHPRQVLSAKHEDQRWRDFDKFEGVGRHFFRGVSTIVVSCYKHVIFLFAAAMLENEKTLGSRLLKLTRLTWNQPLTNKMRRVSS